MIDVTWYSKIDSEEPLRVSLKDRQIYFRHSDGRYVADAEWIASTP